MAVTVLAPTGPLSDVERSLILREVDAGVAPTATGPSLKRDSEAEGISSE